LGIACVKLSARSDCHPVFIETQPPNLPAPAHPPMIYNVIVLQSIRSVPVSSI
jgi:hypothetical protein